MHHDCYNSIIHLDVKSSNILLDSQFEAKITDFGQAKMLTKQEESGTTSDFLGSSSYGHIAPECALTCKANEKMDVYSYGVVLLELTTGREANNGDENENLAECVRKQEEDEKTIKEALDGEIKEECYSEEMIRVFELGLRCTRKQPSARPHMKEVVSILASLVNNRVVASSSTD